MKDHVINQCMKRRKSLSGGIVSGRTNDAVPPEGITLEPADACLLTKAGCLLRDGLPSGERDRLLAVLTHALWAASFRPVLTSFVLERLALPLDGAEPTGPGSADTAAAPR